LATLGVLCCARRSIGGGALCNFLLMGGGTLIWATGKVPCESGHYCKQEGNSHGGANYITPCQVIEHLTREHRLKFRNMKIAEGSQPYIRVWASAQAQGGFSAHSSRANPPR
jgi:hypothetical protein